jgi:hypothetical protein
MAEEKNKPAGTLTLDEPAQTLQLDEPVARTSFPSEEAIASNPTKTREQAQRTVADIIPDVEAARERSMPGGKPGGPAERLRKLEAYDPAGQLLAATQVPFGAGALRTVIANPRALIPIGKGIARTVLGSAAGAAAGGYGGREIGNLFGNPETGREIGATIGGLAGGVAGGMGKRIPGFHGLRSMLEEEAGTRLRPVRPIAEGPAPIEPLPVAGESSRIVMPEHYPGPRERIRLTPFAEGETAAPAAAPESRLQPIGEAPSARSPRGYFNPGRGEPLRLEPLINEATGVKPLKADVPLREQLTGTTRLEPAGIDPIKEKYPDPQVRQMVRANGEKLYDAAKHDPNLVAKLHDLTRVDLRQALINSGEDMGQMTISNSKFAGEGSITREEAFNRLLDKGHKPDDILRLAKEPGRYAYRAHDVGAPEKIDLERSHAHATTSPEEAESYKEGRGQGKAQEVSRVDLSRLKEGKDYDLVPGPRGNQWVRFKTPRARGDFE